MQLFFLHKQSSLSAVTLPVKSPCFLQKSFWTKTLRIISGLLKIYIKLRIYPNRLLSRNYSIALNVSLSSVKPIHDFDYICMAFTITLPEHEKEARIACSFCVFNNWISFFQGMLALPESHQRYLQGGFTSSKLEQCILK